MEITRYKALEGTGKIMAFFSVMIPEFRGMTINNCKLVRTNNGGTFISLPQNQYEKDGETKYSPHIWFEKDVMEEFQKAMKAAINEYVKNHNPQSSSQNNGFGSIDYGQNPKSSDYAAPKQHQEALPF